MRCTRTGSRSTGDTPGAPSSTHPRCQGRPHREGPKRALKGGPGAGACCVGLLGEDRPKVSRTKNFRESLSLGRNDSRRKFSGRVFEEERRVCPGEFEFRRKRFESKISGRFFEVERVEPRESFRGRRSR